MPSSCRRPVTDPGLASATQAARELKDLAQEQGGASPAAIQGPLAVIPIAFFGLVVTFVYVRMGRLWPAIVAHGILDFVGLTWD